MVPSDPGTTPVDIQLLYQYLLSRKDPRRFKVVQGGQIGSAYEIAVFRINMNRDIFMPHNVIYLEPK